MDDQTKNDDPYFIGAFVIVKIAQQQGMLRDKDVEILIKAICKTHDIDNFKGVFENERVNDYVKRFVEKNKPQ